VNLLAEDGSYPKGGEITSGYPQFDHVLLKKLGWWDELERRGEEGGRGQDLGQRHLRRHPARGDEARLPPVRQRQGARRGVELPRRRFPQHREPLLQPASGSGREVPDRTTT
jgi:hypothetical protein